MCMARVSGSLLMEPANVSLRNPLGNAHKSILIFCGGNCTYVYHRRGFDFRKSIVEFRKNPVGQKRCSEFDSLHMLKFHDFSTWDPKKVITSVVLATFLRCLGFPLGIP